MRKEGNTEQELQLTKEIKKMAQKDKKQYAKEKIVEGTTAKEKWQGIKKEKAQYVPKYTKQLDIRGNRVKPGERAKATA